MSERFDAAVIGGGVSGFAAATLLAKSGLRAVLLEQAATLPGAGAPSLRALDPHLVKELRLAKHGLAFVQRDLSLAIPCPGGQPAVIGRDRHAAARSLAALSAADAAAFDGYRGEIDALARALRPAWWDGAPVAEIAPALKPVQQGLLARLTVTSAACLLAAWFESDALKAALAFDAAACGFAPSEPGSALALVWSAAQEMSGLQGAVAVPRGNSLAQALAGAAKAAGVQVRAGAMVSRLTVADTAVAGIELAGGERIAAPLVLSTLSRRRTLESLAPPAMIGLGAAHALTRSHAQPGCVTLAFALPEGFKALPADRRVVIAERLETYETAFAAARLGRMPAEPALDLVLAAPADAAPRRLYVRVWPSLPDDTYDGLADRVATMVERHIPGFSAAGCEVQAPRDAAPSVVRLLAGAAARIETSIPGLLLCGDGAEPADALSGRAARHAASLALALHRKRSAR